VTELLLHSGHTVYGIDSFSSSYDLRLKNWRIEQLKHYSNFSLFHADIRNPADLKKAVNQLNDKAIHAVIHLAAQAGVAPSVTNPVLYCDTNILGTLHMLELCRKKQIPKFIFASSSSVYGNKNTLPYQEEASTDYPLSPYAASKKAAETLAYSYHHLHSIDISILRYFTVYGPAGRPDMSIFRFIRGIAEREPIVIHGDGTQERGFTFVDDIAHGTIAALKPMGYELINLGNEQAVKINTVIAEIEKFLARKAIIHYTPAHSADIIATCADIAKAKRLLNWQPTVPMSRGLQITIEWYLKNQAWVKNIQSA
jgi:nucleoside-diphosphate-sugar epimerase